MPDFENFPTEDELKKKHESKVFPGSHDVSSSTSVQTKWGESVSLSLERPGDGEMYGVFLNDEEVAMLGGSTSEAEGAMDRIKEAVASAPSREAAVQSIRDLIVELHGGIRE